MAQKLFRLLSSSSEHLNSHISKEMWVSQDITGGGLFVFQRPIIRQNMKEEEIEKYIASVKWQFAKSMPEIPHEYIVIENYPEKTEETNKFIAEIKENGYIKNFYSKEYKYLEIDGYKYWVIENIINRAKL